MGYINPPVLERPRVLDTADAEYKALVALQITVSRAKHTAHEMMLDFPKHRVMCQAIADFASDGEGDIRGALAALEEEERQR